LSINNRHRLDPPLPQNYFGNSINVIKATTTAGELLEHNLGGIIGAPIYSTPHEQWLK